MSIKSFIQFIIILIIILIIGGVYYVYFDTKKNIVNEISSTDIDNQEQLEELKKKLFDLELKNQELNQKIKNSENKLNNLLLNENDKKVEKSFDKKIEKSPEIKVKEKVTKKLEENTNKKKQEINTNSIQKKDVKNLVKDVEYTSIDQKGNRFYLLATSGKSNINNSDILDLNNVRGKITSDIRDTIYIVSDFAEYDSISLNSKFYENVIINYQDKEITCVNFDINMETNKAIAYNDVLITDPKSVMKAGIVEFDLKTKNIDIKPESALANIKVKTN
tara:strand:+ start:7957 stop:8787 length:831 start_codon:yes stop_codon:yes gene_type:complete